MASLLHEKGGHRFFPAAPSPAGLPPGPTLAVTPASSCHAVAALPVCDGVAPSPPLPTHDVCYTLRGGELPSFEPVPRRVYLAGPMRGYPRWNAAAFDSAADQWRALGCEVVNPCDLCPCLDPRTAPQDKLDAVANDPSWLREVILADCQQVCQVNAVVVLPGWERSRGATVEVSLALFLGLPVYGAVTMARVVPKPLPWSLLTHGGDCRDWGDVWRNLPDRVGQGRGGSNAPGVS